MVNYDIFLNSFYRSKFFVNVGNDNSGYEYPTLAQAMTNIVKYPFAALSMMVTGLVIAKIKPKPRKLALWNINVCLVTALLVASFFLLDCNEKITKSTRGALHPLLCNRNCMCDKNSRFNPVCVQQGNVTYFSPCYAGCRGFEEINSVMVKLLLLNLVNFIQILFLDIQKLLLWK